MKRQWNIIISLLLLLLLRIVQILKQKILQSRFFYLTLFLITLTSIHHQICQRFLLTLKLFNTIIILLLLHLLLKFLALLLLLLNLRTQKRYNTLIIIISTTKLLVNITIRHISLRRQRPLILYQNAAIFLQFLNTTLPILTIITLLIANIIRNILHTQNFYALLRLQRRLFFFLIQLTLRSNYLFIIKTIFFYRRLLLLYTNNTIIILTLTLIFPNINLLLNNPTHKTLKQLFPLRFLLKALNILNNTLTLTILNLLILAKTQNLFTPLLQQPLFFFYQFLEIFLQHYILILHYNRIHLLKTNKINLRKRCTTSLSPILPFLIPFHPKQTIVVHPSNLNQLIFLVIFLKITTITIIIILRILELL